MTTKRSRVAAFDIRLVIALLIGVYGLVLTVMGIGFTPDDEIARSADVNINLWAGIGMLVTAAAFTLWAVLRPLRLPDDQDSQDGQDDAS